MGMEIGTHMDMDTDMDIGTNRLQVLDMRTQIHIGRCMRELGREWDTGLGMGWGLDREWYMG